MDIEQIKDAFEKCDTYHMVTWTHGLWSGRAIEAMRYGELGEVIDLYRSIAITRIEKMQQAASNEAVEVVKTDEPKAEVSIHD